MEWKPRKPELVVKSEFFTEFELLEVGSPSMDSPLRFLGGCRSAAASGTAAKGFASSQASRIRQLNDAFRASLFGGMVMMTDGVASLGADRVARLLARVRAFTPGNDPYGEHDFGAFDDEGERFFWKSEMQIPPELKPSTVACLSTHCAGAFEPILGILLEYSLPPYPISH